MQNISALWSGLSSGRRAAVIGATIAVFAAIMMLSRVGSAPETALLYAGLEPEVAGEVIAALEQRGAIFEVKGESIFVSRAERDALRLELAAEGLPETGPKGYELLDGMSGFGTTSQMFDAAFLRAKEGELARTILALPGVTSARVHISGLKRQPFRRDQTPSASVTVGRAGGVVTQAQARAIQHLVAASVGGMPAEGVTVIDPVAGIVAGAGEEDAVGQSAQDRAKALKDRAERLLQARVGADRAVVEVNLELVAEREQISERRFDPQGRVAISTDSQEKTGSSSDADAGVTVASNLPEGDAGADSTSKSQSSETRELVNYEVSETSRELTREPGGIRRMSVAVLVDGQRQLGQDGAATWQERSPQELEDLRQLVASAVGIDEARGDVLTLKSMEFEPASQEGTLAAAAEGGLSYDVAGIVRMLLLALVALGLGAFVVRPVLMARASAETSGPTPPALPGGVASERLPEPQGTRVLTGEIEDADAGPRSGLLEVDAAELPNDPVERLRRMIGQRQAESLEILRGWLNQDEERA